MGATPLLVVEGVVKRFGGVVAVNGATCSVAERSVTGLIGPNGSGKSTLFNCIAGVERPDAGQITFLGRRINGRSPSQICEIGLARTFQITRLFREMTVLENLVAVAHGLSDAAAVRRAQELLAMVEVGHLQHALAGTLSYGQRKLVEIARALMFAPKLLLLDEPFAGINPRLQNRILRYLERLRDRGVTLFLIDHEMRILLNICETVLAMDAGEIIAEGAPDVIRKDPRVLAAYF
ncbi:MAG: ABC transporter ATP-binding protein [Candidatus Rokubacteria bacterium]|nr:ABC transporter ATP-binding protein [Candidatus Rokubacteria bacterium]